MPGSPRAKILLFVGLAIVILGARDGKVYVGSLEHLSLAQTR